MAVTARFKVSRHTPLGSADKPYGVEVEMTPDYANGANHEWSQATPSGVCRMTITNMAAVEQLPLNASVEFVIRKLDE